MKTKDMTVDKIKKYFPLYLVKYLSRRRVFKLSVAHVDYGPLDYNSVQSGKS
jgi:hypothetical protein